MKTLREKIEIMEAFERGEKIQSCFIFNNSKYWEDAENPVWDWHFYDYRVKTGEKMTQREFNLIKERLTDWRNERGLTYENQRKDFFGNVFEKVSEYFRAKNDLERVEVLCDIAVFFFNAFDFKYRAVSSNMNCYTFSDVVVYNIYSLFGARTDNLCVVENENALDLENHLNLTMFKIEHLCKNLGFDFYKCMLQTIKEIESRTGFYDERLKKFIKDTSDEAKSKWYKADYESCRISK